MPIRFAIIDDYEVVVRGLATMLTSVSDDFVVVELDSRVPVEEDVDIALYDTFAQTQAGGPQVDELIENPHVHRVVVYSWNLQQRLVDAALEQGVAGYLSKGLSGHDLAEALHRIHAGQTVVPDTADGESGVTGGDWPGRAEGLSAREAEVIALITQGLSNNEIAEKAVLSINSIKTYIRSAYRKMGVTSRTNAVLWGLDHGFAPDEARHRWGAES
jgi:DNA-binding NarL/FixJ family response regulator